MDDNLIDLLADSSEVFLDSLIENELVKEIPVIGTSLKMIRGICIQSIRDKAYVNKVKRFVEQIGKIDDDERTIN